MAVNKIVGAVASALKSRFGLSVYQDQVEQGLKRPCFYLAILSVSMESAPGRGTTVVMHKLLPATEQQIDEVG